MAAPDDPTEVAHSDTCRRWRDWWSMTQAERMKALSYEAGYDDGHADGYAEGHSTALTNLFRVLPDAVLTILARKEARS